MSLKKDALELLKETSRTFYIPISRLPPGLKDAVASAYLCMRAIDQIEDDPDLDSTVKIKLLQQMSNLLQAGVNNHSLVSSSNGAHFGGLSENLPEVSLRLMEWAALAPDSIAPRIWDATAAMADRMAYWVGCNWQIETESDLDRYTFSVAGSVGLLLSDLWAWHDGLWTRVTGSKYFTQP
jgi:farnesyl-diphosphate farnesyltransferase